MPYDISIRVRFNPILLVITIKELIKQAVFYLVFPCPRVNKTTNMLLKQYTGIRFLLTFGVKRIIGKI